MIAEIKYAIEGLRDKAEHISQRIKRRREREYEKKYEKIRLQETHHSTGKNSGNREQRK